MVYNYILSVHITDGTNRCSDNNAEAIIISDGHLKGPDTSASWPRHDAAVPFNTALSDLHPDHSTTSSLRRLMASSAASNRMHATSGQQHGLNLSGDMARVKSEERRLLRCTPHARGRRATRPPAAMQATTHRRRMLHNTKITRHPLQPAAPPSRTAAANCRLYRFR